MSTANDLAVRAEDALLQRDAYSASAESEATAAVAYALLAIYVTLCDGVIYTRDADRV